MGEDHHIKIEGHTGYATNGKDIVCAGISTLAYTMINQLTNMEKMGVRVSYQLVDGMIHIIYSGDEKMLSLVEQTIITGFEMIEENFLDFVALTRGEKDFKV